LLIINLATLIYSAITSFQLLNTQRRTRTRTRTHLEVGHKRSGRRSLVLPVSVVVAVLTRAENSLPV